MQASTRIVVIYDGISNSVFASQVLKPLLKYLSEHPDHKALLVSFESQPLFISQHIPPTNRLTVVILKKIPFFGRISIWHAARQLRRLLAQQSDYHLLARGPLAGLIALNSRGCKKQLTIQARGLLAEEYAYAHRATHWPLQFLHALRTGQFKKIEKLAYGSTHQNVTIEVVSSTLKEYLQTTYGALSHRITIANHDIPPAISDVQRSTWRSLTRLELGIAPHTHVYCYNGSAKAWQCPTMVIHYFYEELKKNADIFLLILTQDKKQFELLLEAAALNSYRYAVLSVSHAEIYKYLAASDTGIIFREPHIINWVSRPTKVLEYHAAQLPIVHNQTIAWLCESHAPVQKQSMPPQSRQTRDLGHSSGS